MHRYDGFSTFNEVGMSNWVASHWQLIGGVTVVLFGALLVWWVAVAQTKRGERDLLSYLLVWPAIFELEKASKKKTRGKFIVIGLILMFGLVIFSLVSHPNVR